MQNAVTVHPQAPAQSLSPQDKSEQRLAEIMIQLTTLIEVLESYPEVRLKVIEAFDPAH